MASSVSELQKPSFGFLARVLSALVLGPAVLAAIYLGFPYFEALIAIGAVLMVAEWRRMIAAVEAKAAWWLGGLLYIAAPCAALLWLRADAETGRATVLWVFVVVWAADTGAYLAGRAIGGPKLAPSISPKKTWAGLIGGLVASGAAGWATAAFFAGDGGLEKPVLAVFASGGIGFVSALGDLLESAVKRRLGVKDSGTLIPGHGGLFDRVDGLFAAAVAAALIGGATGGSMLTWF